MLNCFVNQNVHVYIKHGSFRFKSNENTYPKGRALMQMYRVVLQTKRGKRFCETSTQQGQQHANHFNRRAPTSVNLIV